MRLRKPATLRTGRQRGRVPAKSLAEVIALAKKEGERLTVGTPPAPTLNYFGAEQFKAMTGTKITIVTYKGTAQSS